MPPTRSVRPLLALLAALAVLTGCSAPATAPPASREDLPARIDAFLGASATGRYDLFDPLGIGAPGSELAWVADAQGRQLGGYGLALSAEDMLAIGRLYLAGGRWHGAQLVSGSWVDDATRSHVATGSARLPGCGYQWWVTTADGHPAFAAVGLGGQLVEVVPDLALVTVVRSDVDDRPGAGADAYAELVDTVIAPAVGSR